MMTAKLLLPSLNLVVLLAGARHGQADSATLKGYRSPSRRDLGSIMIMIVQIP